MQVTVSPDAMVQLAELVTWWRLNRPHARSHLEGEFDRALSLLSEHPHIGRRYAPDPRYRTYRLKKTPYAIFYIVDEGAGEVQVDAVWSGMRGEGPRLP